MDRVAEFWELHAQIRFTFDFPKTEVGEHLADSLVSYQDAIGSVEAIYINAIECVWKQVWIDEDGAEFDTGLYCVRVTCTDYPYGIISEHYENA
jgi:hypothetical protein